MASGVENLVEGAFALGFVDVDIGPHHVEGVVPRCCRGRQNVLNQRPPHDNKRVRADVPNSTNQVCYRRWLFVECSSDCQHSRLLGQGRYEVITLNRWNTDEFGMVAAIPEK